MYGRKDKKKNILDSIGSRNVTGSVYCILYSRGKKLLQFFQLFCLLRESQSEVYILCFRGLRGDFCFRFLHFIWLVFYNVYIAEADPITEIINQLQEECKVKKRY